MTTINIKQFCKEFKAYEEKVGKTTTWRGVLSEVGNVAKNESTRSFKAQGSPFGEPWKPLAAATLKKKKDSLKFCVAAFNTISILLKILYGSV